MNDQDFIAKREEFRKAFEPLTADQCVSLLSDLYFAIEYKHMVELNLKGVYAG